MKIPKNNIVPAFLVSLGVLLLPWLAFLIIPPSLSKTEKIIEIPSGASLRQVAYLLEENGLITSEPFFVLAGKLSGSEGRLQVGEYRFHTRMLPIRILDMLRSGEVILYAVTFQEGLSLQQVGRILSERGFVSYEEFMKLAADSTFVSSLGIEAPSVEGYLYPETYHFAKPVGPSEIIRRMVETFRRHYTSELEEKARSLSFSRQQIVTLASIIEKETSVDEERPLIAAVFHNRLKRRMPLQADPTVIYAKKDFNGNLTRRDLQIKSPYNTYRVRGLPPGPIASPGIESLKAALYPAPVNYLYFVSKNDGTHHFSATLAEHNKAVDRYQKRRNRPAVKQTTKAKL